MENGRHRRGVKSLVTFLQQIRENPRRAAVTGDRRRLAVASFACRRLAAPGVRRRPQAQPCWSPPPRLVSSPRRSFSFRIELVPAAQPEPTVSDTPYASYRSIMSTISDKKKRTLEALQSQFAAAKAKKLQDEQLKCLKKNNVNTPKLKFDATKKGKAPESAPYKRSDQPAPRKGVATSSSGHQQKASASSCGESNPVYDELSFALHDNLFQNGISDMDGTEVVHNVVYDIIQKAGDAGRITKGSKKLKLEKGILLDNYVQRGPRLVDAQARSLLIHSKRSKRHMSLKQHKKCGSFELDRKYHKFDLYKPMHEMWKEYIRELTKITPKKQLSENLLQADLHGALLIVVECKAASYQGVSGIMIRDTAETFGIISEDNCFRVVPKAGSVFILQADCWKVTLIGDKLSPKENLKENQRQQRAQSLIR